MPARRTILRTRPVLVLALAASAVVHAGLIVTVATMRLRPPAHPLADAPSSSLDIPLTMVPPAPVPEPVSQPLPPAPSQPPPPAAPTVMPKAAPPAPEPPIAALPSLAMPLPVTEPAQRPAPTPTAPPAPPAPVVASTPAPRAEALAEAAAPAPESMSASFAGIQGQRAQRIVYVIDGSAAMVTTMPFLKDEIARSVQRLQPPQSFAIVVFRRPPGSGEAVVEVFGDSLRDATPRNRAAASEWVQALRPAGSSVPLAGLRRGLAMHPDVIFLVTCSIPRSGRGQWGEGVEATLAELDRLNPADSATGRRDTVIKAVQLLDDDPTGLLPAIAERHGDGEGSYRVLERR